MQASTVRFPRESEEYRRARDEVLAAELELRRKVEEVAAMRRALPLGGEIPEDYVFEEGAADLADPAPPRNVRFSELFSEGQDTLVVYSFMYGPKMAEPCSMCTSFLDGLNGNAIHIRQRVSLAVVAKSPVARVREFARGRDWQKLRLLSSAKNTFNEDYSGERSTGGQNPMLNVFVRRGGRMHHFYGSEALFAGSPQPARDNPVQDARHIDLLWPVWNVLDLTPEGRGDWYPELRY